MTRSAASQIRPASRLVLRFPPAVYFIVMMGASLCLGRARGVCAFTSLSWRVWRTLSLHHGMVDVETVSRPHRSVQRLFPDGNRYRRRRHFTVWASAIDDSNQVDDNYSKTVESEWNIAGLKKEVSRLVLRCHKKVGKASQRLSKAQKTVDRLTSDPDSSLEDLENCPDLDALQYELTELQTRLRKLNTLEDGLSGIKSKKPKVLPAALASLCIELGVDDKPPPRPPRGPGPNKGPRRQESSRKPYRRYFSFENTEIRVGKQAEDNDELTLSPKHRDGADWWMHASGCPGSHVVIRSHANNLPNEVIQDAAALAARQSKCTESVITVSLTRCRDIKKPPGAKAGLVMLTGNVKSVKVNMKEAQARLDRLDDTVLVN